jgi:hypothetical protein
VFWIFFLYSLRSFLWLRLLIHLNIPSLYIVYSATRHPVPLNFFLCFWSAIEAFKPCANLHRSFRHWAFSFLVWIFFIFWKFIRHLRFRELTPFVPILGILLPSFWITVCSDSRHFVTLLLNYRLFRFSAFCYPPFELPFVPILGILLPSFWITACSDSRHFVTLLLNFLLSSFVEVKNCCTCYIFVHF